MHGPEVLLLVALTGPNQGVVRTDSMVSISPCPRRTQWLGYKRNNSAEEPRRGLVQTTTRICFELMQTIFRVHATRSSKKGCVRLTPKELNQTRRQVRHVHRSCTGSSKSSGNRQATFRSRSYDQLRKIWLAGVRVHQTWSVACAFQALMRARTRTRRCSSLDAVHGLFPRFG
jgi:hypothetical protein